MRFKLTTAAILLFSIGAIADPVDETCTVAKMEPAVAPMIILGRPQIAKRGCCSDHKGERGCVNGRVQCRDGATSPTCTC